MWIMLELLIDWLIDLLVLFFVLIQNIFTQIETTSLPVKNCKCCPLLNAEGLWAGRDVSRVIAAKTSGPPKDRPFDHPLRLAWWRLILTRISKGANRFMSGFLHLQRSDCALVSQNKLTNCITFSSDDVKYKPLHSSEYYNDQMNIIFP